MLRRCMFLLSRGAQQLSYQATCPALRSCRDRAALRCCWSLCDSAWSTPSHGAPLSPCVTQLRRLSSAPARHLRSRQPCEHGLAARCRCLGGRRFHGAALQQAGAALLRSSQRTALEAGRDTLQAHNSTGNVVTQPTPAPANGDRRPAEDLAQEGSQGQSVLLHERLWTPQHSESTEPSTASAAEPGEEQSRPKQASINAPAGPQKQLLGQLPRSVPA